MDSSQAACRAANPELFFPVGTAERTTKDTERALVFCRSCPIAGECLSYALAHDHRYGIWGNTTPQYRRTHYRQEHPR